MDWVDEYLDKAQFCHPCCVEKEEDGSVCVSVVIEDEKTATHVLIPKEFVPVKK